MAFRVVLVENEADMHVKLNNLVVSLNGDDVWIPLDDISMIILDNLTSSMTTRILSQLANEGIGLIICDQKHLPIGYYSAYDNHSRASKIIGFQIEQDRWFYDCLWKEIIELKIKNQADAYLQLIGDLDGYEKIKQFSELIEPGDKTNREAHAAKVYFNLLMGQSYSRGNEGILLNSGLDYGYAIIRSYIARLCVGYGLNTQIGIHHKSEYNRFNLVDDLMEPIRPFVDIVAYTLLCEEDYFKPEHRRKLVDILNKKILYRNKNMFFGNMLDDYVSQFAAYLLGKNQKIIYPRICDFVDGGIGDEVQNNETDLYV